MIAHVPHTHPAISQFRADLRNFDSLHVRHETGVRAAFQTLLQTVAGENALTLVAEQPIEGTRIRPDGTLRDLYNLPRGYWESKDTQDDLEVEIGKKKRKGYPFTNILFEDTQKAVLFQNNRRVQDADLTDPIQTASVLTAFLGWQEPDPASFENAMNRFGEVIPDLARGLMDRIETERKENARFATAFDNLYTLCVETLNPQISAHIVVEMLAQHLLTERLFRTIFDNADFVQRNVIAQEVEKTIRVMVSLSFNRGDFTKTLDKYYVPIEAKAREAAGWEQKQKFLNDLYERFFQDFSKKAADTQGIVYTPQPIVNFMVESVDALLKSEFGTSLSHKGVVILDPCVGTGNFMQNILRRIPVMDIEHKYRHELFCNENMLLPYYIASLNIEHAFFQKAGNYEAFPGLCFTDTLMLENGFAGGASGRLDFFSEENAERVQAEQAAPVTVIIGNPPYNVGQMNENENNKNRVHSTVAKRLRDTYVKDSKATNKNALWDMYVRFFRWATDRLGDRDGIIAFVSNNSFVRSAAFDGMRKHLASDFTTIYHLDFRGNAHTSGEPRRREGGNIFNDQIRTSVGITILVRSRNKEVAQTRDGATILYHGVADYLKAAQKTALLQQWKSVVDLSWEQITPNEKNHWLNEGIQADYESFMPMGGRAAVGGNPIFRVISGGLKTSRDDVVYDFNLAKLQGRIEATVSDYNAEVKRWLISDIPQSERTPERVDGFVDYSKVKWSRDLKADLRRGRTIEYSAAKIHFGVYRPFAKKYLYLDRVLNEEVYNQPIFFPTQESEQDNVAICLSGVGHDIFYCLAANGIAEYKFSNAANGGTQCFPFYTYDPDGTNRRENLTNDALAAFRARYADTETEITKQDIFAYIYALLHHPDYRARYRENLKRELPRIPFALDATTFRSLSTAGSELITLHTGYETAPEYPLQDEYEQTTTLADLRHVQKMRLSADKTAVVVNPYRVLRGIPSEAHDYKLGSRSALDWIIDQYRVKNESDPNRADDPGYIISLVKRIVTVSVETVRIVGGLPPLGLG